MVGESTEAVGAGVGGGSSGNKMLCDFCEGRKTNVKAANNRIYRRCPSCRAFSDSSRDCDFEV
ncbi:hypothetical protein ACSBR1_009807 [Camellia fascicularis]